MPSFEFLFEIFGYLLSYLYDLVPSYGFTIIGLTLVVMIIVTPLTLKATRSMLMMQQLQPEMKKIQSRYKDDRQKLNEEMLKFYKENSINPVGGCLPLLIQTPVFIVLYNVLRGLTLRVPTVGSNIGSVIGQANAHPDVAVTKPPAVLHFFDPQYLPKGSNLDLALRQHTEMKSFGVNLAESFVEALARSVWAALPFLLLIAVVAVTGFVQQRQISGRNTGATINPQQQQIMKIMPVFLPLFSLGLQSGLVLYFAVSNLWRVAQQWFITRNIYGPHHAAHGKGDGGKAGGSKGDTGKGDSGKGGGPKAGGPTGGSGGKSGPGSFLAALTGRSADEPSGKDDRSKTGKSAKAGAPSKSSPAKAGTKAKVPAGKGGAGGRTSASSRPGDSGRRPGQPNSRTTKPSGQKQPPKNKPEATTTGSGSSPAPTLQPRARKKKR